MSFQYLAQIGYCPQFDGINGFLTGEEMLQLFANLRGIPQSQIQPQVNEWISLLGKDGASKLEITVRIEEILC